MATSSITKIKYDKIRLHLRSGFSFASRGYDGFLFEIKTKRISEIENFLTQIVYLNTSSFEIKNPKPFILSETLYSNFIEIKIPSIVGQFSDFENLFYDNGSGISDLDPTSNYTASLKLIDSLEDNAGIDIFTQEKKLVLQFQEKMNIKILQLLLKRLVTVIILKYLEKKMEVQEILKVILIIE